jgi:ubiquinone/menaquinone biosynthesis C-methylase UbiE
MRVYFDKVAAKYEGEAAALKAIASHLLTICPPLTAESVVLDNACGPGIVTGEILKLPAAQIPSALHAADFSPNMIEALRAKSSRDGADGQRWKAVQAQVMDAQNLGGYADDTFTHSFTSFAIFCCPEADKAAAEIYRTLKAADGVAVVTTWETLGYLAHYQRAVKAVSPDLPMFEGPLAAEWMTDAKLRRVMEAGGFNGEDVDITAFSAFMTMREWSEVQHDFKLRILSRITNGWTAEHKATFEVELQREIVDGVARDEKIEMRAWIARARK